MRQRLCDDCIGDAMARNARCHIMSEITYWVTNKGWMKINSAKRDTYAVPMELLTTKKEAMPTKLLGT